MPRHLLEIDDLSTTELNKVLSLSTQNSEEILLGKGAALLLKNAFEPNTQFNGNGNSATWWTPSDN